MCLIAPSFAHLRCYLPTLTDLFVLGSLRQGVAANWRLG